jgi:hypothetical protein
VNLEVASHFEWSVQNDHNTLGVDGIGAPLLGFTFFHADPGVRLRYHFTPSPGVAEVAVQIVISLALLATGLVIILGDRFQQTERHWACGAVGTIVGFWLNGGREIASFRGP